MAKYLSYILINVRPLSQNYRPRAEMKRLRTELIRGYVLKYLISFPEEITIPINCPLEGKLYYLHRDNDGYDADNISKPTWDALEGHFYENDRIIKYIEVLKIDLKNTPDFEELEVTDMSQYDFNELFHFIYDDSRSKKKLLYISLSDYQSKNVRFI
jgi:Holliday junction resolvase RusA-like endonuclease